MVLRVEGIWVELMNSKKETRQPVGGRALMTGIPVWQLGSFS